MFKHHFPMFSDVFQCFFIIQPSFTTISDVFSILNSWTVLFPTIAIVGANNNHRRSFAQVYCSPLSPEGPTCCPNGQRFDPFGLCTFGYFFGITGYYRLMQVTERFQMLIQVTAGYYRLLHVTAVWYRLLQGTTVYYRLLKVTAGYYRLN